MYIWKISKIVLFYIKLRIFLFFLESIISSRNSLIIYKGCNEANLILEGPASEGIIIWRSVNSRREPLSIECSPIIVLPPGNFDVTGRQLQEALIIASNVRISPSCRRLIFSIDYNQSLKINYKMFNYSIQ